jgi:hypothetical protein
VRERREIVGASLLAIWRAAAAKPAYCAKQNCVEGSLLATMYFQAARMQRLYQSQ